MHPTSKPFLRLRWMWAAFAAICALSCAGAVLTCNLHAAFASFWAMSLSILQAVMNVYYAKSNDRFYEVLNLLKKRNESRH